MPGSEPGHAPQRSLKTCGAIGSLLLPVRAPEAQLELHVGCELDGAQCATRRGGNNLAARALWNDARRGENGADRRVGAAAQLTRILRVARRSLITLDGRVIARVISRPSRSFDDTSTAGIVCIQVRQELFIRDVGNRGGSGPRICALKKDGKRVG